MAEQVKGVTTLSVNAVGTRLEEKATRLPPLIVPTARACFELHGFGGPEPPGGPAVFMIEVIVLMISYPFSIIGGTIGGNICHSIGTEWVVTGGSFGPNLFLEAKRVPLPVESARNAESVVQPGGTCSSTMTVFGNFQTPDSWAGMYGFDGSSTDFSHTTLFKGWAPCA